jgi:2-polyprenyl-3-methyl-5-hydroxy-6-metoxy-1,4-benzoquinol methylase
MSHERAYEMKDYERWARNTYRQLKGWLPADSDASILDAACGHGNVVFMLEMHGYRRVEGVDLSEEQVALARQVAGSVHQGDVLSFLAERHDTYDAVIAFDLIEHFSKQEALIFLRYARDSLRSGGQVILQTPNAASPFGCGHRYHDFTHEIAFDPASLAHVLRLSGFQDIQFRETGPTVHGPISAGRWVVGRGIRRLLQVWNLAETGTPDRILTRVFRAKATRA